MTFKINRLLFLVMFVSAIPLYGQDGPDSDAVDTESDAEVTSPWLALVITDEMTKDPEQNRQWRLGQYKYSAQPKNMWELGIHSGHFFIDGDVDTRAPGGLGVGLHLRKALTYFTSIRFDGFYGQAKGLESQPWRHRSFGGGLVESNNEFQGWESYNGDNQNATSWFPSYKTSYYYGAVQLIFNIGNVLFHKERNKWNTYVAFGAGLNHHNTQLDLVGADGSPYEALRERTDWSRTLFNTTAGRKDIRTTLDGIYDGVYETDGFKKEGIFRFGDDFNVHVVLTGSVGVSRKISRRINLGFEHQVMVTDNDYLDGIKFRTATDQSNNLDIGHYTNLRLGLNMGNFDKRIEPLYWVNPMETIVSDVAELKSRPRFEWEDEDNDGVLDLIDQELDTPEGCLVDTKGVTLDSDGDGVVDCRDREPYSPPGYPVDENGVAQIDDEALQIITEQDVITIIKNNCSACQNVGYGVQTGPGGRDGVNGQGVLSETSAVDGKNGVTGNVGTTIGGVTSNAPTYGTITHTGCGNWFLPMIHYDLDKYAIRPESYVSLHQIANVMRKCGELCVTAHGHTDVRNSNNYNRVLSYNRAKEAVDYLVSAYGIDRSRLKLMYGGEESPLIPNLQSNHYTTDLQEQMQFINRRVEFSACEATDMDMSRPEGRNAGVKSLGSSRPGSKYDPAGVKGNKNAGY
ncbi:MAG: OOP family OmpA-OmpF porin [Saprospiraceae bacterium]|jgi:OOP family OmpA-OmpF porin